MQATLFSSWCREAKISFWKQQWVLQRHIICTSVSFSAERSLKKLQSFPTVRELKLLLRLHIFYFMSLFTRKTNPALQNTHFDENSLKYSDSFSLRYCFLQGWGWRDTIIVGVAVRRRSDPTINSFKAAGGKIMMSPATVRVDIILHKQAV